MRPILLFTLALADCAESEDPCTGLRDLVASPEGLALTEDEHPAGWGHTDCFLCHQAQNIHEADCSTGEIDVSAIDEDADNTRACAECHGYNGVEAWVEEEGDDTGE